MLPTLEADAPIEIIKLTFAAPFKGMLTYLSRSLYFSLALIRLPLKHKSSPVPGIVAVLLFHL
jgi:hypothetical protein